MAPVVELLQHITVYGAEFYPALSHGTSSTEHPYEVALLPSAGDPLTSRFWAMYRIFVRSSAQTAYINLRAYDSRSLFYKVCWCKDINDASKTTKEYKDARIGPFRYTENDLEIENGSLFLYIAVIAECHRVEFLNNDDKEYTTIECPGVVVETLEIYPG